MHSYKALDDPHLVEYFRRRFSFSAPSKRYKNENKCCGHRSCHLDRYNLISNAKPSTIRPYTLYKIIVTTADVFNAGTSANVYLIIKGEWGSSTRQRLQSFHHKCKDSLKNISTFEPGSTKIFHILSPDLGALQSVVVEHDSTRKSDSWLLESIQVIHPLTKKRYMFLCNHWLSLYKEDGLISRELFGIRSSRTKYAIVTVTGDKEGAGTNGKVFITIYGRTGITPRIELRSENLNNAGFSYAPFGRGMSTKFIVFAPNVGALTHIRIKQDGLGNEPDWFLERVVVTDLSYPQWTFYFHCGAWLSKNYGDGNLCRVLRGYREPSGTGSETQYGLTIYTADKPNAGTTANVYIQLFGKSFMGREIWLDSTMLKAVNKQLVFNRGSCVQLILPQCSQLGELVKIKIGHDSAGDSPSWLLEKVIVDDLETNCVYEFPCNSWINKPNEKILLQGKSVKKKEENVKWQKIPLEVRLFTGDIQHAGTSSHVFLYLSGPDTEVSGFNSPRNQSANSSQRTRFSLTPSPTKFNSEQIYTTPCIWLRGGKFEQNIVTHYRLDLPVPKLISPCARIIVGHDSSGQSPNWFLEKILIYCPLTGIEQTFLCHKWLNKGKHDEQIKMALVEDKTQRKYGDKKIPWLISVKTSNITNAGTDAQVHLVLYGNKGQTDEILLRQFNLEDISEWTMMPIEKNKLIFKPGLESQFRVYLKDFGIPYKLRVAHDNKGSNPSWHLEEINLKNLNSEKKYVFYCNRWLSIKEDDHAICREIPAQGPDIKTVAPIYHYIIQIFTGNKTNANTKANIFMNIFGDLGDCGIRWLTNSINNQIKFQKNQMDEFIIEAVKLGKIYKIQIGHNDRTPDSGWYLAKVIISIRENPKYKVTFECYRWFDVAEEDGLIVRELISSNVINMFNYKVTVTTGTSRNAGTNANVSVRLFGTKGETGDIQLKDTDTNSNKFEPGKTDTFNLSNGDLGEITKIRIWHDGITSSSGWFLDEVIITDYYLGRRYVFKVNRWLSKSEADGRTSLDLEPTNIDQVEKMIPHEVVIFTGDVTGASSKTNIFIQIYGTPMIRKSDTIQLTEKPYQFKSGQTEIFRIFAPNIGPLQKLVIGRSNDNNLEGWFLDKVLIRKMPKLFDSPETKSRLLSTQRRQTSEAKSILKSSRSSSLTSQVNHLDAIKSDTNVNERLLKDITDGNGVENYWFFFNSWLSKHHDDKQLIREAFSCTEEGQKLSELIESTYEINVKTGNRKYAGTDASIYLKLFGKECESREYQLEHSKTHQNKFEQNQTDVFEIKAIGLGQLEKIRIRHNNKGVSPSWFLDYIHIKEILQNQTREYLFPCYQWLSGSETDGLIVRELPAALPNLIERWKSGHNVMNDARLILEDLTTTYNVRIYTGKQSCVLVDFNAYISIYGDKNVTDKILLCKTIHDTDKIILQKFASGQVANFVIKAIQIGSIRKIRIGQKGLNIASEWFIERVEIDCPKLGLHWGFKCNKKIGPKQPTIELYPEVNENKFIKPMITYEIKTFTSDLTDAGTTANVFIQLYGEDGIPSSIKQLHANGEIENRFQSNKIDTFYIDLEELKEPYIKLRVWHDEKGISPDWHLNKIELRKVKNRNNTFVLYTFPCENWLSRTQGNGAVEQELIPTMLTQYKDEIKQFEKMLTPKFELKIYEIRIITGDRANAGTNATVYLTIYGENGDSGERKLFNSLTNTNKFERGQTDVFHWKIVDLGKIVKIRIRHDNCGLNPSWFLSRIELCNITNSNIQYQNDKTNKSENKVCFNCECWLCKEHEDDKLVQTFYPEQIENIENNLNQNEPLINNNDTVDGVVLLPKAIPYHIQVVTGSYKKAGTTGPVWIHCFGKNFKNSGKLFLIDSNEETELKRATSRWFRCIAPLIDEITEIQVGNDASEGPNMGWFLSHLLLDLPTLGKLYRFNCKQWFSKFESDKKTVRCYKIDERNTSEYKPKITYSIQIATSDEEKVEIDCNIFIQLFGCEGQTEQYRIEKIKNRFERGVIDKFDIEMENVGSLCKIRIGHDNQGNHKHWKFDHLLIQNTKTNEEYTFIYNDWLSERMGKEKKTFVDIPAFINGIQQLTETDLVILVKTGTINNSGTDANVYIQLFGEFGDSGILQLKKSINSQKPFQNGSLDEFKISNILKLGTLARCRIWHDNKGLSPAWYCQSIEIREVIFPGDNPLICHWVFECNKWLSINYDDKQFVRDLKCSKIFLSDLKDKRIENQQSVDVMLAISEVMKSPNLAQKYEGCVAYEVTIKTGNLKDSGTVNNAWIIFEGNMGRTMKLKINNTNQNPVLQTDATDKFIYYNPPIGKIEGIHVGVSKSENHSEHCTSKLDYNWFCETVTIRDPVTGSSFLFDLHEWLSTDITSNLRKDIYANVCEIIEDVRKSLVNDLRNKSNVSYKISVFTGKKNGGGTDANLFITLYGCKPGLNSGRCALKREHKNLFEKNQLDEFVIECRDLEFIKRVLIEHDNSGISPDWYLDKIMITDLKTNQIYNFTCEQWLSKKKGDCKLWKELYIDCIM